MRRGEIWFAAVPDGGDRPVVVLTRDPVADRVGRMVVGALTRARRGLVSGLVLTSADDGVPSDCRPEVTAWIGDGALRPSGF